MKKVIAMIALAAVCFGTTASAFASVRSVTDTTKVKIKKKAHKVKIKKKKVDSTGVQR